MVFAHEASSAVDAEAQVGAVVDVQKELRVLPSLRVVCVFCAGTDAPLTPSGLVVVGYLPHEHVWLHAPCIRGKERQRDERWECVSRVVLFKKQLRAFPLLALQTRVWDT